MTFLNQEKVEVIKSKVLKWIMATNKNKIWLGGVVNSSGVDFLKIALNSCAIRPTFNWEFWLDWATDIYENLSFSDAQLPHLKKQLKSWAYGARIERKKLTPDRLFFKPDVPDIQTILWQWNFWSHGHLWNLFIHCQRWVSSMVEQNNSNSEILGLNLGPAQWELENILTCNYYCGKWLEPKLMWATFKKRCKSRQEEPKSRRAPTP